MDWLENLLPFVILLIYLLRQVGKRRATPPRPAPQPDATDPETPRAATPFEELVRQIQEAARQPEPNTPTAPRPVPRAAAPTPPMGGSVPLAKPVPPSRLARVPTRSTEFHATGGFDHEGHGFGPASPFSEERFEHQARGTDVTEHAPGHLVSGAHDLFKPTTALRPHPLAARLAQAGSARDAYALREILGPPRSRRRR